MKWIGALLVMLAGFLGGLLYIMNRRRRLRELRHIEQLLKSMETEIRFTALPVAPLLLRLAEENADCRLLQAVRELLPQHDFYTAWNKAVKQTSGEISFSGEEEELLLRFGAGWGKSDVQGEVTYCHQYADRMDDLCGQLMATVQTKSRLYLTAGVCAGLLVAILLL